MLALSPLPRLANAVSRSSDAVAAQCNELASADCLARLLVDGDRAAHVRHAVTVRQALLSPRVWLLGVVYFTLPIGLYGFNCWLPQIVQGLGALSHREIGLLTVVPNLVAAAVMYGWARYSDTTNERRWHFAIPALAAALGLAIARQGSQEIVVFLGLTFSAVGILCDAASVLELADRIIEGSRGGERNRSDQRRR